MHVRVCRKDDIFRQRRLNHSGVGGRKIAFRRVYPARAYTTFVVLVRITCAEAYWSTLVGLVVRYQSVDILLSQLPNTEPIKNRGEEEGVAVVDVVPEMKMTGEIIIKALVALSPTVHHKQIRKVFKIIS